MDRDEPLQEFRVFGLEGLIVAPFSHHRLDQRSSVARGLDGQFGALPHQPRVLFTECCVVGLAEHISHILFWIAGLLKGDPDEGEEPHHAEQVAGSGVVLAVLLGRLEGVVVVAVVGVDMALHFEADEGEEAGLCGEEEVVGADDGYLFLDVGEGDAEEGVEGLED